MKKNQLVNILTGLGLSDNEARVYIAALSLGPATVLQISRESGIKRTTVYSVLESLKQKGLAAIEFHGFKQLYAAERPERLEIMLTEKKRALNNAMPEFSALFNLKGEESLIRYYEGLEAGKAIYEDMLRDVKPHEDYLVISDQERWYGLDQQYFQKFIEKRAKLNINIRLLLQDSPLARQHKQREQNYNERIKILPQGRFLTTNLIIIPKRVVIQQLVPPIITAVIENKSIIEMHREIFEIIWATIAD